MYRLEKDNCQLFCKQTLRNGYLQRGGFQIVDNGALKPISQWNRALFQGSLDSFYGAGSNEMI